MTSFKIIEFMKNIKILKEEVDENGVFQYSDEFISELENEINATKEQKLNVIQDYKLSLNDEIARYKDKKKKLDANIKRVENHQDYLKSLQEILLDGVKLKTDEFTFSFRKSKSVVISNLDLIEDKYCKFEKKPDTKLIKEQIEMCDRRKESFFGAEIVTKTSLSIR